MSLTKVKYSMVEIPSTGVLAGSGNEIYHTGAFILGNNIVTSTPNTTYTNNLLSDGFVCGNLGTFTSYLSSEVLYAENICVGNVYGNISTATGVTDVTKLPLTGGTITGDLLVTGTLTSMGSSKFVNSTFTTTSALSVVSMGPGPGLYVYQGPGAGDVASFYDGDGVEVLHVGNALNPAAAGVVGIKTSVPNKTLSVNGEISATSTITSDVGFSGPGTLITAINASNISIGNLASARLPLAATFTTSVSAPALSGKFFGDGSGITGVSSSLPSAATFTTSVSAPALCGRFFGDGSALTGITNITAGTTDNAILRSDGVAGSTLQNSNLLICDYDATVLANVAIAAWHASATNVSVAVTPKGNGAFILGARPDNTSTGGNTRGASSIDLQLSRNSATQVASGANAITIGTQNTASAGCSLAIGFNATSCASFGNNIGTSNTITSTGSYASIYGGNSNQVSGCYSSVFGGTGNNATACFSTILNGNCALADRYGSIVTSNGIFAAAGDSQSVSFVLRNKTTNNTATELFTNGSSTRLTIPTGKVYAFTVNIVAAKSDGTGTGHFMRKGIIKNVSNTTSLVGSIETIGTDNKSNASLDISITADDTNDALKITVTGITSETWRWTAVVDGAEIAYGV